MSQFLARWAEDWMEDERWYVRVPAVLLGFLFLWGSWLLAAVLVIVVVFGVTLLLILAVRGHL